MSEEHLRKLIEEATRAERRLWLMKQTMLARALRKGLGKRLGRETVSRGMSAELPEEHEIVNETIVRVLNKHDDRYIWDGTTVFDAFFEGCMVTTLNSLRSAERRHHVGSAKLHPDLSLFFATPHLGSREQIDKSDEHVARAEFDKALAAAIADTRMSGNITKYAARLLMYANQKMTKKEIATDLGVKPGTVDPYRKRIRRVLKDPEDE